MVFLLDASVLIALTDPAHVQHDATHEWFAAQGRQAWATCPLTENAVLRIVGHARYPNSPGRERRGGNQSIESLDRHAGTSATDDDLSVV